MIRSTLIILILSSGMVLNGQNNELREIFTKAEDHYLFNEYELANPLYLILNDYAGNANISYHIGNCYLYIEDEKTKAIPFLEEAIVPADRHHHRLLQTEANSARIRNKTPSIVSLKEAPWPTDKAVVTVFECFPRIC